ncbi:hypothetical protein [Desulfosporosinus lacus]|uniref:Deacetylase PdaC domain-containing protein n=1 Tax=Desulfosporosinus lacus DSM 15449 TaxID=1121420 RepID=A0A1M5QXP9_9FIRM|nr:hypothetical protein [Desulfosporosinus lacus]SHH18914.1 hypothetical protein SAMN02746098_00400 [Desulfosporosinus lacus DSM 15449]
MKKWALISLLFLAMMINGCGDKKDIVLSSNNTNKVQEKFSTTSTDKYDIVKATFRDKTIMINYPQISNLSDSGKEEIVNKLIMASALEVLDNYKDDISSLKLDMDFEIKYKGTDLLSIQYLGTSSVKDSAYPVNLIQTANIDLRKEKNLTLSDVVTMGDGFINKFTDGKYIAYGSDLDLNSGGVLKDVLSDFSSKDLEESFKQHSAKFYFTKDTLGVSVEVPHAVGDHLEMEMDYKSLEDILNPDFSESIKSQNC